MEVHVKMNTDPSFRRLKGVEFWAEVADPVIEIDRGRYRKDFSKIWRYIVLAGRNKN